MPEQVLGINSAVDQGIGSSRSRSFNLIKEAHVRLTGNSGPLHRFSQNVGLRELAGPLVIIPFHEDHHLIGVTGVTEELPSLGTHVLAGGTMLIEHRLPPGIVLDVESEKYACHICYHLSRCGPENGPSRTIFRHC